MAQREIVLYPHPALTTPGEDVVEVDDDLRAFLDDLAETMYAARGLGLAAQQVGDLRRVCIIDIRDDEDPEKSNLLELINPRVVEFGEDGIRWEEGCLSFPELFEFIERPNRVVVEALDRHGKTFKIEAEGLLSVALQHEIDHLDGIVFLERMSRLKRKLALRKWNRILAALDLNQAVSTEL